MSNVGYFAGGGDGFAGGAGGGEDAGEGLGSELFGGDVGSSDAGFEEGAGVVDEEGLNVGGRHAGGVLDEGEEGAERGEVVRVVLIVLCGCGVLRATHEVVEEQARYIALGRRECAEYRRVAAQLPYHSRCRLSNGEVDVLELIGMV